MYLSAALGNSHCVSMLFVSCLNTETGRRSGVVDIFNKSALTTEAPPRPGGEGAETCVVVFYGSVLRG